MQFEGFLTLKLVFLAAGGGVYRGYFVAAFSFTHTSKFPLKPHEAPGGITFWGDVWKLKCGLPNFTQIIPVNP